MIKHQSLIKLCVFSIVCTSVATLTACGKKHSIQNLSVSSLDISNPPLEITILDTGKSDCILIELDEKTIMIDTGLDKNGEQILDTLYEKGITDLDYLILTHMDKDHIGGADIILDGIPVSQVIQADYAKDTNQYEEYIDALNRHNISPILLHETLNFTLNDVKVTLYPAQETEYEQSNDYSIITSLIYGDNSFLFAGDAESQRLTEFINSNPSTYTFLKIPHHGKNNEMLYSFLKKIKPEYAVITCSDESMPDNNVISMLNELGTQILLTSNGTVNIKCDGHEMLVTQQLSQYITFETHSKALP